MIAEGKIGKYEIITKIGAGGMADVFLAIHRGPGGFEKLVVIKKIHRRHAENPDFIRMFLDEARLAAHVNHAHVVQVFELGEDGGTYFIAMEYLRGESLGAIRARARRLDQPVDPYVILRIIADAADGLDAAHESRSLDGKPLELVHRDVSPSNILISYDGAVKVADFGIARAKGRLTETSVGKLKGKYAYMSPEQLKGLPIDRRSDVFSLGVVLWETLAARRLFKRESESASWSAILHEAFHPPSFYGAEVPREVDEIARRALARDVRERYQTAAELRDAIDDHLFAAGQRVTPTRLKTCMHGLFAERIAAREALMTTVVESADTNDLDESSSDEFDPGRTIMDPREPAHEEESAADDSSEFDPPPTVYQPPPESPTKEQPATLPLPPWKNAEHWQTAALVAAMIAVLIVLQQIAE